METSLPPQAVLERMINGYWVTGAVHAAARLRVADALAAGPLALAVDDLAERIGADPGALYRLLRALASLGVFTETAPRTFGHTPVSEALRTDVPGSMHGLATMTGLLHLKAWPDLVHSVRTGETAFEHVFGAPLFAWLKQDQEAAAAFDAAMAGYTAVTARRVVDAYDFSAFGTVCDIGGGNGALLTAIARRCPGVRGIAFDLPHVAARAGEDLAAAGLADRIEAVGGDFFEGVPAGADAYTAKMILHDWDDARSLAILRRIREVIPAHGRLLVMDAVLPPGNEPSPGKLLDLNMLVMTGGRERTEAEFRALFAEAGFEVVRVVQAGPTVGLVEGRPV